MIEGQLTKAVQFFNERLDKNNCRTEFARGNYIAYSIAKIMIQNILFEMLGKALTDSMRSDDDVEYI